jgi:hypothetical protein
MWKYAARVRRRLLKRPRHLRAWPRTAWVMVAVLVLVVVAAGVLAYLVRPAERPSTVPDTLAAEGALFGAGAFIQAVIATVIAIGAYINSTEKPMLSIAGLYYPGRGEDLPMRKGSEPDWGLCQAWSLNIKLRNVGAVAARAVAVRVTFERASLRTPAGLLAPWKAMSPGIGNPHRVWWEGGADAFVHPDWDYDITSLGPATLGMDGPHDDFAFVVEVALTTSPPS